MFEFAHMLQLSERQGLAADAALIELTMITRAAAGFPGIYSSTEHALPASGFHTYIHTQIHTHTLTHRSVCT